MKSDLAITAIIIYDGEFYSETKNIDKIVLLVEGMMEPHHVSTIQARLLTAHQTRHLNRNYIPSVYAREIAEELGYRIIDNAVVYNMDYTGVYKLNKKEGDMRGG